MKTGIELIAEERQRQISQEGWTPEHDRDHDKAELYFAAMCYFVAPQHSFPAGRPPSGWPWAKYHWKPKGARRNCEIAGALVQAEIDRLEWLKQEIAAEIDRLQRKEKP